MDPKKLVDNLREKPYQTRVRILWGTVIVVAVILLGIWVVSLKSTVQSLNVKNPNSTPAAQSNSVETTAKYIQVERIEAAPKALNVYFNINNTTDNILNFSQMSDISLRVNDTTLNPKQVTDRQGAPFAKKILSHTQVFGILIFDPTQADTGKLTFDNLSFDNTTNANFKQILDLDFKALENSVDLRK